MNFLNIDPPSILVVGDIMLDIQIQGIIEKIANEAPIPVLHQQSEKKNLGGCGNVLMNLEALGCAKLYLLSMVGDDRYGEEIQNILNGYTNISYNLLKSTEYCTTVKTRGFSDNKIIFRYDIEKKARPCEEDVQSAIKYVEEIIKECRLDGIIMSDYNKGFLTKEIAQGIICAANKYSVPTFIDPKIDYTKYIGCTLFKPNIKEIKDIFGITYAYEKLAEIHKEIKTVVKCNETLLTLSERGISYMTNICDIIHVKTKSTEVRDVTGAGDIVLSIIAYFYKHLNKETLIRLATWFGTHSVRFTGTYVIQKYDLFEAYKSLRDTKLLLADDLRKMDCPIIITNGCFDIVHEGHISLFKYCKSICPENGVVVVALNGDTSIRRLKGDTRPINNVNARITLLSQIESIDWIVVFDEDTPYNLYEKVQPEFLVKGGDYKAEDVVGREFCGEVKIFNYIEGKSTTSILKRLNE
jgi:D-beta-D-heptose 7-phosphate kinase/D-beta-D-heptose 1-phosphate adenosyltransferase